MLIGKRINDRYKILQLIGGGGMSNVYLAHDIILNREVAVKILRYDASNEEEFHRRFQREALSATSLLHPNIVSIYDVGEDGDMHYIVMEYVKGKTLKQYINEFSPLSPSRSVQIMKQLTSAIAHAHENQIIHRDIKPQNILMDQDGNIKVTDFGIATSLSATSYTKTNSVIGTVHYLSPEQARGGSATKKSDIYALGIVLYELLTGELPFSGESAVSIALKHLQTETPSLRAFDASIPQSLENVVLKATAKNPDHRYASVEEMGEDLRTVLSPDRLNELKFTPPIDDDETKAIPIIKERMPLTEIANTKVLSHEIKEKEPVVDEVKTKSKNKSKTKTKPKKKNNKGKIVSIILAIIAIITLSAFLVINLITPSKFEIPDVSNLDVEEATKKLEDAGFVVGDIREKNSDEIEEGLIIETNPKAGLTRVKGTEINLIQSIGSEKIEMSDYVGQSINQVTSILENAEFADYEITEIYSPEAAGTILEQEPKAGEEVNPKETIVKLTISKGKNFVTVSNLIGYNEAALKEFERTSGLKVKVKNTVHHDTAQAGTVISQNPAPNAKIEAGGTIEVDISKGPAAKQSKVYYKDIVIPYEPINLGEEQKIRIFIQDKNQSMGEPTDEFTITEDRKYRISLEIEEGSKAVYRIERDSINIVEETIPYETVN
ncbi:Stk1 family PASTA domain-containing Ser/Thr kinase [Lysinibacillus endophyticus]|uniref:Stk1 family PASTA domain-containing Ser/Thr kinase n=1 Tax=Ureibacillus endophyticus TaxID=1978490 RepID=UPI0020A0B16C|nr:Stk1 family PASTA domain-containing Ser/Thr kinase [Lysinibacillus endophyticus]MCP1143998.1 Stk1 family PASTA domain-containing Ser/Thr kinase [Lysinibacillus endophyticus]